MGCKNVQLVLRHCFKKRNSDVAHFTTHESNMSCNKSGCCNLREHWFCSDKITRESLARELRHYLQSNGKTGNINRSYLEPLYTLYDKFSQPATTWFVARQVGFLVRGKTQFNSFCSNVANKLHDVFLLPVLPYLYLTGLWDLHKNNWSVKTSWWKRHEYMKVARWTTPRLVSRGGLILIFSDQHPLSLITCRPLPLLRDWHMTCTTANVKYLLAFSLKIDNLYLRLSLCCITHRSVWSW